MAGSVFIVEDDADVRNSLCALIEAMGHSVKAFGDAEALLACPEQEIGKAACFVIDLYLPGQSGVELIRQLKAKAVKAPLVAISGDGTKLGAHAAKAGATLVLRKPLAAEALTQLLDSIFTR